MSKDLKERTKKFAVNIIRFIRTLPKNDEGYFLANSSFDREPALALITGPPAKENQLLIL